MTTLKTGIAGVLTALLAGMVTAQQGGMVTPQQGGLDKAAILRELDKLEQSHKDKLTAEQKSVKEDFGKALSSTKALLELYEEAVFATKFEGGKKDNSEFKKWKNSQDDMLKSDDFQAALALHANYLHLTFLRASGGGNCETNAGAIRHFVVILVEHGECEGSATTGGKLGRTRLKGHMVLIRRIRDEGHAGGIEY